MGMTMDFDNDDSGGMIEIDIGQREAVVAAVALGILVAASILLFTGGERQVVYTNHTTHTTVYTDGSVDVNNSEAVGTEGSAMFEKDMDIEVRNFHGYDIFREYMWVGIYEDVRFPEYRPPTEEGRTIIDIESSLRPDNGVPEVYAGVSPEEDASGEGYIEARFYFDEEFRGLSSGTARIHWGPQLEESKDIDWEAAEIHDGIYLATARDYNLSRHSGGAPTNPFFVGGYLNITQMYPADDRMRVVGYGVGIE